MFYLTSWLLFLLTSHITATISSHISRHSKNYIQSFLLYNSYYAPERSNVRESGFNYFYQVLN